MSYDLSKGNSFGIERLNLKEFEENFNSIISEPKKYRYDNFYDFTKESLITINENDGQRIYDPTVILKNSYWGQLKLFLSEFCVLTNYMNDLEVTDILYIGAAPGNHIYVLAQLFENYTYHLYDSRNYDKRLYKLDNVNIYKKYFDDIEMEKWKKTDRSIFLISDIRTLTYSADSYSLESQKLNESAVWGDMKLQQKWIEELQPTISLVKFRLPFGYDFILKEGKTRRYLDGKIMRQVYNKPTSSETRLLITDISYKEYDIVKYERQLCYHNTDIRNKLKFKNILNGSVKPNYEKKGLLNNFDDTYFISIVIDYIRKIDEEPSEKNIKTIIDYILENINIGKVNLLSKKANLA